MILLCPHYITCLIVGIIILTVCLYNYCCTGVSSEVQSDGDVRLVGGRSQYVVQVEIYYRGLWLAARSDSYRESSVVCKQLGYSWPGRSRTTRGYVCISDPDSVYVSCSGGESSLAKCKMRLNNYNCHSRIECINSSEHWFLYLIHTMSTSVIVNMCQPE